MIRNLFIFIFFCGCVKSEFIITNKNYELDDIKTFGGSHDDEANDIINTSDGGFMVIGSSKSNDGLIQNKMDLESDIILMKFDNDKSIEWVKNYGGSRDDRGQSVVEVSGIGYALLGYSMSNDGDASHNEGFHDNWVILIDSKGNIVWEKSYGFSGHDHAYNIIKTKDGNLFFNGFLDVTASRGLGSTEKVEKSVKHGVGEFWCHKIDLDGNILWRKYFGGTNNDRSYDSIETADGDFIIVGSSESTDNDISSPKGSYDIWVIKLSSNGDFLWERSYGGSKYETANSIIQSSDKKIHILGSTLSDDKDISFQMGSSDFYLLTIDSDGNLLSEQTFGGSNFDMGKKIEIDNKDNLWLTGYSRSLDFDLSFNKGKNDAVLVQLSKNRILKKVLAIGAEGEDIANSLIHFNENEIIVAGYSDSRGDYFVENKGGKDIFLAFFK
ncbi:MAG: hypothetical protein CMC48_07255 [Flavobacteriaceae bacterium]|nr:hypothetical protein [Flavobacteriaceae bacterium]